MEVLQTVLTGLESVFLHLTEDRKTLFAVSEGSPVASPNSFRGSHGDKVMIEEALPSVAIMNFPLFSGNTTTSLRLAKDT